MRARRQSPAVLRATELLCGYLSDMLDSADDKLFDLSEGQQTGALDAMRELRLVMGELGFVVTEVNQALIESGVLPDMTVPPIRASRQPGQAVRKSADSAQPAANPVESLLAAQGSGVVADPSALYAMFGELLEAVKLLSMRPDAGPAPSNMAVMQGGVAYVNGAPVTDASQVRQVSSNDLVGMLNRLQRVETSLEELEHGHDSVAAEDIDVRVELSGLLGAESGEQAVHALDQADDAVINLVSMLFDFIFDDQALATEIKALIGRLQIPFLKTAIADKTFFSNEQHPARVFLNTLARAGSQWSSSQGVSDPLYRLIRETVFKVLNDFDLDAGLFERLRVDVEDVVDRQESQRQRIEERVQEVEQGKVLAEQTRRIVTVALQERIGQRALPAVAVTLIRDAWQQVLYLTCLREGSGSDQWNRYLKVLEVLVWSVLPKKDEAARSKLADLAPKLQVSLRKGLEAIGFDARERQRLLDELTHLYAELVSPAADNAPEREVVLLAEEPEAAAAAEVTEEDLPIDHPTLKQVSALKAGVWIDIGDAEDSKRLRLAANVRHGSKLVFINARGIREAEYSGMALARAIEAGTIRLVDGSPLFDRALESVIGNLRKVREQVSH